MLFFFILQWLDNKHVVLGKVVEGLNIIKTIESLGSRNGKPAKDVVIEDCGQL